MKSVFISGASRGLGKDLSLYFLEKDYKVFSFSRNKIDFTHKNLLHFSDIDALNTSELKKLSLPLSQCEYLINNVGIAYDGILATQSIESIQNMISVNITSVIYLTKLWIKERMKIKGVGSCVNISSIISKRGFSGLSVYSSTKGALNSFTQSLAREMGPQGFRFNAILPGYFESDLSKSLSDEKKNQIIRRTPLGRLATKKDIYPIVDFILSDSAQFITGQLISVDGGLTV